MNRFDKLIEQLIFEEGLRLKAYRDTKGIKTIGVGHNMVDEPNFEGKPIPNIITKELAMLLLDHDIKQTFKDLNIRTRWFRQLSAARQDAIMNMAFQLGITRFLKFKRTIELISQYKYKDAAVEMLDSKWARIDSPGRASRVSKQFATGVSYELIR